MTSMIENQNFQKERLWYASSWLTTCARGETSYFSTQIQQMHRTRLRRTCNNNSHVIHTWTTSRRFSDYYQYKRPNQSFKTEIITWTMIVWLVKISEGMYHNKPVCLNFLKFPFFLSWFCQMFRKCRHTDHLLSLQISLLLTISFRLSRPAIFISGWNLSDTSFKFASKLIHQWLCSRVH